MGFYNILSNLLDLCVLQLGKHILLRSTLVYKLIEFTLSTPPLLFRRQPSQLNCLSAGFFSFFLKIIITLVNNWYLTFRFRSQLFCILNSVLSQQITVKFLGSFRPSRISGYVHPQYNFDESLVKTAPRSLLVSCESEFTRQGVSLP